MDDLASISDTLIFPGLSHKHSPVFLQVFKDAALLGSFEQHNGTLDTVIINTEETDFSGNSNSQIRTGEGDA